MSAAADWAYDQARNATLRACAAALRAAAGAPPAELLALADAWEAQTMAPIPREVLPRWPAASADGTALGGVVWPCGCPPDGACTRPDCPHRSRT